MIQAHDIQAEWDEGGLVLMVETEDHGTMTFLVLDAEQLFENVRRAVAPWIWERDTVKRQYDAARKALPEGRTTLDELERLHDEHTRHLLERGTTA